MSTASNAAHSPRPTRTAGAVKAVPGSAQPPPRHLRAVEDIDRHFNQAAFDSSAPTDVPAPEPKVIQLLALYALDALEGLRAVAQLAGWITPAVADALLERRAARTERRTLYQDHRRLVATPGPVHIDRPAPHVVEASLALHSAPRTLPVAMRLEHRDGKWRVTELDVL